MADLNVESEAVIFDGLVGLGLRAYPHWERDAECAPAAHYEYGPAANPLERTPPGTVQVILTPAGSREGGNPVFLVVQR